MEGGSRSWRRAGGRSGRGGECCRARGSRGSTGRNGDRVRVLPMKRSVADNEGARTSFPYRDALLLVFCGLVFTALACDSGPQQRSSHFSLSDSVYSVTGIAARLPEDDDRVALGSVMDVAKTDAGYVIADIRNARLVFLDFDLNPVATAGRAGDGPGEFRGPYRLVTPRRHGCRPGFWHSSGLGTAFRGLLPGPLSWTDGW